jgi:hypothetical protein
MAMTCPNLNQFLTVALSGNETCHFILRIHLVYERLQIVNIVIPGIDRLAYQSVVSGG